MPPPATKLRHAGTSSQRFSRQVAGDECRAEGSLHQHPPPEPRLKNERRSMPAWTSFATKVLLQVSNGRRLGFQALRGLPPPNSAENPREGHDWAQEQRPPGECGPSQGHPRLECAECGVREADGGAREARPRKCEASKRYFTEQDRAKKGKSIESPRETERRCNRARPFTARSVHSV